MCANELCHAALMWPVSGSRHKCPPPAGSSNHSANAPSPSARNSSRAPCQNNEKSFGGRKAL
eukprot:10040636-Alexandrium_andersonii.AAC.1